MKYVVEISTYKVGPRLCPYIERLILFGLLQNIGKFVVLLFDCFVK